MVEVIVPWLGGCEHRERARDWVTSRLPYPVTIAEGSEPWCKADAVMPAIEASTAEIIAVHDADVLGPALPRAVADVKLGAPWAMPHRGVFRLTEESTAAVYAGVDWEALDLDQPAYLGWEGGGCVVAKRETLLDVPLDRRFIGWGMEDESWAIALSLLAGRPCRVSAPLVHLWHPPQERADRRQGSPENWKLGRRYVTARRDPAAMRSLLEEIPCQ